MTTEKSKSDFKTRLINFVNAFDSSPSDYLFDSAQYSREKLHELEARIERLEANGPPVAEVARSAAV